MIKVEATEMEVDMVEVVVVMEEATEVTVGAMDMEVTKHSLCFSLNVSFFVFDFFFLRNSLVYKNQL